MVPSVIMHRVADIRGGVSVDVSELGGDFLPEGAPLSAPVNGICHVVKTAVVASEASATATTIKVKAGHNFKAGDFVMAAEGAKAYAITSIAAVSKDVDELTLSATLGVKLPAGTAIAQAAAESASNSSALKYEPLAIAGTGNPVVAGTNLITDAWVIAVTKGNALPDFVASKLKGVINY